MKERAILDQVETHLKELGLHHSTHERGYIMSGFRGRSGVFRFIVDQEETDAGSGFLLFIAAEYLEVPPDSPSVDEMAKVLLHINRKILLGAFAMDLRDGEVSFGITVPLDGEEISAHVVERCVSALAVTIDGHWPVLNRVLWGGCSAEEALGLDEEQEEEEGVSDGEEDVLVPETV